MNPEVDIRPLLESEKFDKRENERHHTPYRQELRLLNLIRDGDVVGLRAQIDSIGIDNTGRLSRNKHRQQMYLFVSVTTLATRFALDGGMDEDEAYILSDIYIQKADDCQRVEEIHALVRQMMLHFTESVRAVRHKEPISAPIRKAQEYIFTHLHTHIELPELARHVGFSKTYLSHLFRKETGNSITEYLHKKRVEAAEGMLLYSEYTLAEIATNLGFCSQSHFAAVFRRYTGTTPSRYREERGSGT